MLHVLICEDDPKQRAHLEATINHCIVSEDYNMDISCSAASPDKILNHLQAYPIDGGLYFLDVDLQSNINGIELAAKIRAQDVSATIVFVTTLAESMHLVFRHKVEALDYIVKDSAQEDIKVRIAECIKLAASRFLAGKHNSKFYMIRVGGQMLNIPYDDILYFETNPSVRNRLFLHKLNGEIEFRGTIQDVAKLGYPFYKTHQSFVVNVDRVVRISKVDSKVELEDGTFVPIASRKVSEFLCYMETKSE